MNIFKKITLILSVMCVAQPAFGMEQDNNQGFFGRIWNIAKEHPVIIASVTGALGLAIVCYDWYQNRQQRLEQERRGGEFDRMRAQQELHRRQWGELFANALKVHNFDLAKQIMRDGEIDIDSREAQWALVRALEKRDVKVMDFFFNCGYKINRSNIESMIYIVLPPPTDKHCQLIKVLLENASFTPASNGSLEAGARFDAAYQVLKIIDLPDNVICKILSFLPEDISNVCQLAYVQSESSLEQLVAMCPFEWFQELCVNIPVATRPRVLAKLVPVIVDYRLNMLRQFLTENPDIEFDLGAAFWRHVHGIPGVARTFDFMKAENVDELYREAVEQNVRAALMGIEPISSINNSNN
ncbi:MAG: hypothetical protein AB7F19_02270 [Candidatus Babeliales bacterium]